MTTKKSINTPMRRKRAQNNCAPKRNVARKRKSNGGNNRKLNRSKIMDSPFLKCSLANIDFQGTGFNGVPDGFSGKVFTEHWSHTSTITVAANTRTVLLLSPSVGYPYFVVDNQAQSAAWNYGFWDTPDRFPDYEALFPTNGEPKVSDFRLIGSEVELTNTTPLVERGGSIRVCEISLERSDNPLPYRQISGASAYDQFNVYSGFPSTLPVEGLACFDAKDGLYTRTYNRDGKWEWHAPLAVREDADRINIAEVWDYYSPDDSTSPSINNGVKCLVTCFDNAHCSKLVIIDAPNKAQTFTVLAKQCASFRPIINTLPYRIASNGAKHEPAELALYAEAVKRLPIAVTRKQNDNFWAKVKRTLQTSLNVLERTLVIGASIAAVL